MTVACYPLDAVSGSPEYTGRMLRDTLAALVGGASSARPLGAFSGVRPGTPSTTVTLAGLDWNCEPHAGILDVQAAAEAGPYLYAVMTDETGTLDAQAVGNGRSDLLVVQLSDPAESDGSSVPEAEVVYVPGTAGPGAPDPDMPDRSMLLGRFNVPQSGGGSPTFTWLAPTLYAAGARPSVPSVADLADLDEYPNMEATVEATPGAFWKYIGSAWVMYGTARFADAATRTTAIASPAAGMRSWLDDVGLEYVYRGSAWVATIGEVLLAVTSFSGLTVTVDDLPTGFTGFRFELVSEGTAASLAAVLRTATPSDETATNYDRTALLGRSATPETGTPVGQASWGVSPIANTSHHVVLDVERLTQAHPTSVIVTGGVHAATAVQDSVNGVVVQRMRHRLSTIYRGIKFTFSASQTGYVRVIGKV